MAGAPVPITRGDTWPRAGAGATGGTGTFAPAAGATLAVVGGVAAPPETPAYKVQHEFAETWREQKLRYEQNDRSNATVPVLKVVTTASEHKAPNKNAPIFLRKPAGLPGGLSLIKNE